MITQSVSKLWIVGSFYLNRDYIAKNVCVNRFDSMPLCKGSCFLNDKLEKAEQEEQRLPDIKQKDIQLICQKSFLNEFTNPESFFIPKYSNNAEINYQSNFSVSIFHPPRMV